MELYEEIKADREAGARRLVDEYRSRLMGMAMGLTKSSHEAEDLVFRTFERVILKIDDKTNYVKRIVGLPGDTIRNDAEGKVYRISPDGAETLLDEPYAYFDPLFGNGTFLNETGRFSVTLADDEIFVMGDNRYHSKDSRSIGPLKQSSVLGVVHPWVVEYRYKLGWLYYYL